MAKLAAANGPAQVHGRRRARVIHPGGRTGSQVRDDGCGVAATVIEIARFGAQVTSVGIERLLMERAEDNPEGRR